MVAIDRYPCTCCGLWTLSDPSTASYEICPVCYWESDPVQREDPTYSGGANGISLRQARRNFVEIGACSQEFVSNVRHPMAQEFPDYGAGQFEQGMHILAVLRGMRAGAMGLIAGARTITFLAQGLLVPGIQEHLDHLAGLCSETDDIYVPQTVRKEWRADALLHLDAQVARFEARVLAEIGVQVRALEEGVKAWLRTNLPT